MLNFNPGDKITLYKYFYSYNENKVIIEPIECIVWEVTRSLSSEPILEEAIFRIEKEVFPSVNLTYKYPEDFCLNIHRKSMLSFEDKQIKEFKEQWAEELLRERDEYVSKLMSIRKEIEWIDSQIKTLREEDKHE